MGWTRLTFSLAARSILSPPIAVDLLRVLWRFRARDWYKHVPFIPVPARIYIRWRMHTAYGDYDAVPPADDVVRYAQWSARNP